MRTIKWVVTGMALLCIGTAQGQAPESGERLLGYSRAAVERVLPNLPADQLDLLVYRIPTLPQIMQNSGR